MAASAVDRRLPTAADTERLGRALADACRVHVDLIRRDGLHVNVSGDLGVGKTALVRAWLRAFGVVGPIRSPTFAVLEPYLVSDAGTAAGRDGLEAHEDSSLDFYHFDFYRFADPAEFGIGFRDQFRPGSICAIEWAEKAGDRLPQADLTIALEFDGEGRRVRLDASSPTGAACLKSAVKEFDANAAG
jgi:tRNA threonylcarbamoyladenosine biosynthesis protein TsaE